MAPSCAGPVEQMLAGITAELVADVQHLGRHVRAGSISRAEAERRLTADWPACRHQAGVLLNEWRELHAKTGEKP